MRTKLLFSAAAAVLLCSCASEDAKTINNNTYKNGVQAQIDDLQLKALENLRQSYTLYPAGGVTSVTTKSGVVISVTPNALTVNGKPTREKINIEFIEIYKRSDMVTANKTTQGIADPENQTDETEGIDLWPLESGGEFYVNMTTTSGQQVDYGSVYTLTVPSSLTGGPESGMVSWRGNEDGDGNVTWVKNTDAAGAPIPVGNGEQGGYGLTLANFGWANIDRFSSYTGPKTTILVDVPAGYDNTNCMVYLATEGDENLLARLDHYDTGTQLFSEHYGQVPVGLNGYIVFVSGTTSGWEYAILPVNFTAGLVVSVNPSDIITGTQADVETAIDALP